MALPVDFQLRIPRSIADGLAPSEGRKRDEVRRELAITLYRERMFSFEETLELAGLSKHEFSRLLGRLNLSGKGCEEGKLHIVFEERGDKEDRNLELEFRRVLDEENNQVGVPLPFNIVFSDKQSNSAGLQLADLVARPIGRHILKPEQRNRAYDVIEEKLRRGPDGEIRGKALKVFP